MAKRRKKKYSKKKIYSVIITALVLLAAIIAYFVSGGTLDGLIGGGYQPPETNVEGSLEVHFIDVGQADSILVRSESANMLIDTGDLDDDCTASIISYLEGFGITKLDYLVLTHPDADHIGGAPEIINGFTVVNCIMPNAEKSTKIFESTVNALEEKQVNVIEAVADYEFKVGEAQCRILAPINEYDDVNDMSAVIQLYFGEKSILFTGDAESESEADMIKRYTSADLNADVLKVGHHGSSTSTSQAFLDLVNPEYAVISCGEGNSYGHPHDETIDLLEKNKITYYRTDVSGTIVLVTDGKTLTFTERK